MQNPIAARLLLALVHCFLISIDCCFAEETTRPIEKDVDFAGDVRPILEKHCWSCHGQDKNESGLRLDRRDTALLGGDSGKAIQLGKSADSKLIQYVAGTDPDHVMPPEGPRLSDRDQSILRAWIDQGLVWPDSANPIAEKNKHWAYQPLGQLKPPVVKLQSWPITPIDQFVLAKLEERGLVPSVEADRFTLIRRLYLDLIGLLPPLDAVSAFVNDKRPNAYEILVDDLLKSPHFGERWGRHWLDMARYADSDGYEKDNARPDAYRWRDWVIDAINQDMPFNQFTTEQLAGDLLPNATDMQKLATAFHRQTLTNTEGGTDQEQFRVEACFDRTETTGAVWLGLTVGCARCHSHKYDAISQREYYQLFAFFNNADEKTHTVPKSAEEIEAYRHEKENHDRLVGEVKAKLKSEQLLLGDELGAWETETRESLKHLAQNPFSRELLEEPKVLSDGEVTFAIQKDGSFFVSGNNPEQATYTVIGKWSGATFDTLRLDVLSDKSLPGKGPGRVKHGNFVLSEIALEVSDTVDFANPRELQFASSIADHEQAGKPWLVKFAYDQDLNTGWAIGNEFGKDHWAEFQLADRYSESKPSFVRIKMQQLHGQQHTIGKFRISLQRGTEPKVKVPENIAKILAIASEDRSDSQRQDLLEHFSRVASRTQKIHEQLEELAKKEPPKPELSARVLGQREKDSRKTFVLRRGEFLEPLTDAEVLPSALETLPKLVARRTDATGDRLDLAKWLVSQENPIVPRVTVNHVWRLLFGNGLVKTANDFGVRGDRPSHPELLDWMAKEFITSQAWSRKSLIKQIVLSATYRQSSQQRIELSRLDPQNLLLARQNRLRVEGEIVRDISLDASDLLVRKIGGPSVFPALPPGIAELSYAGNFKWKISDGDDRYRRGMYTFFKRTSPHPNLIAFDCPDANLTCVDRNKSNTPLQALVSLNNESFAETARALAKRVLVNSSLSSNSQRLAWAVQKCIARPARDQEIQELSELLLSSRDWYAVHPDEARKLIGAYAVPDVAVEENAAWISTARILFNLDEFITRE
jgi:cytochrome c553